MFTECLLPKLTSALHRHNRKGLIESWPNAGPLRVRSLGRIAGAGPCSLQQVEVVVGGAVREGNIFTPKHLGQLLCSPSQGCHPGRQWPAGSLFSPESGVNKTDTGRDVPVFQTL